MRSKLSADLSKTLNSRKTSRKFASQIICVFGKGKGSNTPSPTIFQSHVPQNKRQPLVKKSPAPPKTLTSRKTSKKFASQIICVFGKGKGKQYPLSHKIQKPRPAPFWTSSDQPHSVQTVTQDCHYEENLPTPKKQTVLFGYHPSPWVHRQIKAVDTSEGKAQELSLCPFSERHPKRGVRGIPKGERGL